MVDVAAQAPFPPCRTVLCVMSDDLNGLGCSHRVVEYCWYSSSSLKEGCRTNRMCTYVEKEVYFKELAHAVMEAGNSRIYRMDHQGQTLEGADAAVEVQRPSPVGFPLAWGSQLC